MESKNQRGKVKAFKDFVNDRKPPRPLGQYVTSTDGKRVVMASPCKGRKQDQRKRKRCVQTSSVKKANIHVHVIINCFRDNAVNRATEKIHHFI